jgi:hypothetical protein
MAPKHYYFKIISASRVPMEDEIVSIKIAAVCNGFNPQQIRGYYLLPRANNHYQLLKTGC